MEQFSPRFGVLLINLGTPDSPRTSHVRRYLREFLMDKRVIDIPFISRWLLVNLIIANFRAPKSAKVYKKVWTQEGSPLKYYGFRTQTLLQEALGNDYFVRLAMRYQNPSIKDTLKEFESKNWEKLIIIPLFPQYASATTGSIKEAVMKELIKWQNIPAVEFVQSFYKHPLFIKAFTEVAQKYLNEKYDHYIFSYHGLPERQIRKADKYGICLSHSDPSQEGCCSKLHEKNFSCYRSQCFETTRLLAKALHLPEGSYTTSFQSRLGKAVWIQPYTEEVVRKLAQQGKKRILAFAPSFVADCLETTIEVGEEYKELFEKYGGKHWQLVESLNDSPIWIELLRQIVLERTTKPKALDLMMQVIAEEKE